MHIARFLILVLFISAMMRPAQAIAVEPEAKVSQKAWQISAGAGLIVAPAFTGAKTYNLLAVPDIRITYKDIFFANVKEGVGYAVINSDGWRVGPVLTYTFSRSEKDGGSPFRVAGGESTALQGLGDVPGTVLLGGFAEYSLKPYKVTLRLHKGITGHEGVAGESGISYGGVVTHNGPPLIYSVGPHVKFGDRTYTNAYWGISPEQSLRSGLERYHADGGITAYGVSAFALVPWTKTVSVSVVAGFDRLAPPVADSPLVRRRGAENQAFGGLFLSYGF
ncbi:MAG: MipA/OmpV family protein [Desulfuromonadaceae bacterium]|nr:MipA/OmpV family protein [Desulfuromonadaceae bacterium]